jgi:hypothetical protein
MEAEAGFVRRYLGPISVEVPEALRDETAYQFIGPDDSLVRVERVEPPNAGIEGVLLENRRNLRATFGADGRALGVASIPGTPLPNRHFAFETELSGPVVLHFATLGGTPDESVIVFQYVVKAREDVEFSRMLRSFAVASGAVTLPEAGRRRLRVDRYTFDARATLAPPTQFVFERPGLRLAFGLDAPLEPTLSELALEMKVEDPMTLSVVDEPVRDSGWNGLLAQQRRFRARSPADPPGAEHTLRIANVRRKADFITSVLLYAAPGEREVEALFQSVLLALRLEAPS